MIRDTRTTTPAAAAAWERANTSRDSRYDGVRADDTIPAATHGFCGDPHCWACFLLPAVTAQLVADLRGAA